MTVQGGRIRGIAPQVLAAEIQNQSVKALGKGNLVLCGELVQPFGVKSIGDTWCFWNPYYSTEARILTNRGVYAGSTQILSLTCLEGIYILLVAKELVKSAVHVNDRMATLCWNKSFSMIIQTLAGISLNGNNIEHSSLLKSKWNTLKDRCTLPPVVYLSQGKNKEKSHWRQTLYNGELHMFISLKHTFKRKLAPNLNIT